MTMADRYEFAVPPERTGDAERYMQRVMHEWTVAALLREEEWLKGQLGRLTPGDRLCVHGRQTQFHMDGERGWTHTFTTAAHVLPPGYLCADQGERIEYGSLPTCKAAGCTLGYGHAGECV